MSAFDQLVSDTRETVIEHATYNRDFLNGMSRSRIQTWLGEELHEIIDGAIPIYNHEIMALASDWRIWQADTDEFGTARDLIQATQWATYVALDEAIRLDESILDELETLANPVTA